MLGTQQKARPGIAEAGSLVTELAFAPRRVRLPCEFFEGNGDILFEHACKLGCEGIVSKRLGSPYRSGRSPHWVKVKNPKAPAVKREAEEDWR